MGGSDCARDQYHASSPCLCNVYRCVHGIEPAYLVDALELATEVELPDRRRLRSSSTSRLAVPSTRLHTIGDRAFSVAAARFGTA